MKKVLTNFIYQGIFQVLKLVIPIVTIPIVSRALGPSGLGLYNFSNSIAQYFILFAALGMSIYGNREIAINRTDKYRLSKTFWELEVMSAVCAISLTILYIFIFSFSPDRLVYYVQSLSVIAVLFDISWFFMGLEDFKQVSLTNVSVQLFTLLLIVLFVRRPSDTILYIGIQSGGVLLSAVLMWVFVKGKIEFIPVRLAAIKKHFFNSLPFFIPQVSVVIYTNLNKTMLGLLRSKADVGFFSNGLQLITVTVTLITTLDIVLLPRMSNYFAQGRKDAIVRVLKQTLNLQLYFSIPIFVGVCVITPKLVPWFFGSQFTILDKVIPALALLIIVIPIGTSIARQYQLPVGKIKDYNLAVVYGAAISVGMNVILIPLIGIWGAIIATLIAEGYVSVTRIASVMRGTGFKYDAHLIVCSSVCAIVMGGVVRITTINMRATVFTSLVQVVMGVIVYFGLSTLINANPVLDLFKRGK